MKAGNYNPQMAILENEIVNKEKDKERIAELEAQIVELVRLEKPSTIRDAAKILAQYEQTPSVIALRAVKMIYEEFCSQKIELDRAKAWQKESVKIFLSLIPTLEDQRCPHWHIKKIKELIKQAEDN